MQKELSCLAAWPCRLCVRSHAQICSSTLSFRCCDASIDMYCNASAQQLSWHAQHSQQSMLKRSRHKRYPHCSTKSLHVAALVTSVNVPHGTAT